jgi:aspartyl protease family protein
LMRGTPLLWIILALLTGALLILVLTHDSGTVAGIGNDEFAGIAINAALVIALAGSTLAAFRGNMRGAFESALLWFVIIVLLMAGYSYRFELRDVANRMMGEAVPGFARVDSSGREVTLVRDGSGHFRVRATINGAEVTLLFDTGASQVVLRPETARRAGINVDQLTYDVNVSTANGRARAAAVQIDRMAVGPLEERRVSALVAQQGALNVDLLGMSFLDRLSSFEVTGPRLILRGPAR